MSGLCSIFPGNTYFLPYLGRYFKDGTVKNFIDAEAIDIKKIRWKCFG